MATEAPERVALNADVVGYSRLLADDFEATTARMEDYAQLVEDLVSRSGGTLVNFVGDNFMAVFDDAISGITAAIAIATEVESRNSGLPELRQMWFRMGMDRGEVAVGEDQYFGDALNIAARIQAIAPTGGLGVSGAVYRALDEPVLRFRPLGKRALKNIPEETEVYEFLDLPSERPPGSERSSLSLEPPTVAVLPFHDDQLENPVRSTLAMIRGELVHRLSRVPQLRVVDAEASQGDVTLDTRARYSLEAGTHQVGERATLFLTLSDATTWNIVKSLKWSAPADELSELSEQIADEVASSIEVELIVGEPAGLYAELDDAEAMEKIYQGWYELGKATPEGWHRSLELFEEVAKTHPDKPFGYVLGAFARLVGYSSGQGSRSDSLLDEAHEAAQKALSIGDPTGIAHMVEAAVLMTQGKGDQAIETMEGVEITRPTCDITFGLEGSIRRYMGQWEKAVDLLDHAMRLTGVNKPWYPTIKACSLFMGGKIENAASTAERVLEYQPNNLEALLVLTAAQVELGLERRARANADLVRERFPSVDISAWLERNPYQDPAVLERWKDDLEKAGVLEDVQ